MQFIKKTIINLGFIIALLSFSIHANAQKSEVALGQYVNPMIGTSGHSHTFPGATTPFGMIQLSPTNGFKNWDWCAGISLQ